MQSCPTRLAISDSTIERPCRYFVLHFNYPYLRNFEVHKLRSPKFLVPNPLAHKDPNCLPTKPLKKAQDIQFIAQALNEQGMSHKVSNQCIVRKFHANNQWDIHQYTWVLCSLIWHLLGTSCDLLTLIVILCELAAYAKVLQ